MLCAYMSIWFVVFSLFAHHSGNNPISVSLFFAFARREGLARADPSGYFTISSATKPPTGAESLEIACGWLVASEDLSVVANVNESVTRATLPIRRVIFVFIGLFVGVLP